MARSTFLNDVNGSITDHPAGSIGSDAALGAGKGLGRIAAIGLRIPVDFAMGITSGFHNAPKLYGDDTVRPAHKVTGFNSGLNVATKVTAESFLGPQLNVLTTPRSLDMAFMMGLRA